MAAGAKQLGLAPPAHRADALIPALDPTAAPDRKHDGLAAVVRGVELLAALEPARVVHAHQVAGLGPRARALDVIDVAESGRGLDDLFIHGRRSYLSPRFDQVSSQPGRFV